MTHIEIHGEDVNISGEPSDVIFRLIVATAQILHSEKKESISNKQLAEDVAELLEDALNKIDELIVSPQKITVDNLSQVERALAQLAEQKEGDDEK